MKIARSTATIAIIVLAIPATAQRQRAVLPVNTARVEVLSAEVDFGSNAGQTQKEVLSAIAVRVFSPGPWALRLLPTSPLTEHERGEVLAWERVEWRTHAGGTYQPVLQRGSVVARGRHTGLSGEFVTIDLRIAFSETDPLGKFGGALRIVLDTL